MARGLLVGAGALALAACRDGGGGGGGSGGRAAGRVVVVGAGLAGLTAARTLAASGWNVTVLEARDRVGGRVLTARLGDGQTGELGGEFIDRDHAAIQSLASDVGLTIEPIPYGPGEDIVWRDRRESWADYLDADGGQARRDRERFYQALYRLGRGVDPGDPAASRDASAIDRRSVADLLAELALSPRGRWFVERVEIVDEYTVTADRLSLLQVVGDAARTADLRNRDFEVFRIAGGNGQLPARLADDLGDAVQLGAPVEAVAQDDRGVEVHAGDRVVTGDYAVIATPLPPLRRVRFDPVLPDAMAAAVADLGYGTGTKTLLAYSERVWQDEGYTGYAVTDFPVGTTWEASEGEAGVGGILLGYTVGPPGATLGDEPGARRFELMSADAETLFPGSATARSGDGVSIAWQNERYTGGTYTAYRPGQVTAYWRAIREPFGRVHWAGEQTDVYTAYMEGAVRSGRRAALEITARG